MADRILTTHVGSLPRSAAVTDLVFAQERGEIVDAAQFDAVIGDAVDESIRRQVAAGIDIVADGEMSKISYATYVKDRITGFDGDSPRTPPADLEEFPGFLQRQASSGGTPTYRRPRCVGPVAPKTLAPLEADLRHLQAAVDRQHPVGAFMNAASPGVIALFQPDDHYGDPDAYLEALAEAMRPEYEAIVAAGFLLQLDSPDIGLGRHMTYKDSTDDEYLRVVERHVEVLNHALRNVPAERVRMHVCWGNYEGPHHRDIEMRTILPALMKAKPQGLLVVAQRIASFTALVGADRVIAGSDCGFSTFAGFGAVDPDIVYSKLETLAAGAEIASTRLR